jgi:hypothetical protein
MTTKLQLDDIADLRAYERERDEFRARIIALKRARRVGVGPFVTFVFENRETIRFQVQEMARAERLATDAAIEAELETYNPLIPDAGCLSATMFIELTTTDDLQTWLPRLVGIERTPALLIGDGPDAVRLPASVDPDHERRLTRDDVTASVHYVRWALPPGVLDAFRAGPVTLAVEHPAYRHAQVLGPDTLASLAADLGPPRPAPTDEPHQTAQGR